MAKKPISQKRAERQQQENAALQKVLNVFLLGIAAECWLLLVYRNYDMGGVNSMLTWHEILKVCMYAGLVLLAGGIGVTIWKRECPKCRKIMPLVALLGLLLTATGWVATRFFPSGTAVLCIIVPIITLLGLVFYLYQHECFLSTVALSGSLFASWVCASGTAGAWRVPVMIGAVCCIAALAAAAVLTRKIQQDNGKLSAAVYPASYPLRCVRPGCRLHRGLSAGPRRGVLCDVGSGHRPVRPAGVLHHQTDVNKISEPRGNAARLFLFFYKSSCVYPKHSI